MNLSKPVNPIRNYAVGSVITALILLSPVVVFLMVIAAEMLIDLLMVGGTSAVCVVAAGSIGLVLSRKFWRRPAAARLSRRDANFLARHARRVANLRLQAFAASLWPQWLRQSAASHAARSYNVSRSKILRL